MKNPLLLIGFLGITILSNAQQNLQLNLTHQFSSIQFTNSEGIMDDNISSKFSFGYTVAYEKAFDFGMFIRPELGYRNNGAYSSYNNLNLEWDYQYADLNLSVGYKYAIGKLKPQISIGFFGGYLLDASQIIGQNRYDLLDLELIEAIDFGVNAELGIQYAISEKASAFVGYRHSIGLAQLEISDDNEEQFNRFGALLLGISYQLSE